MKWLLILTLLNNFDGASAQIETVGPFVSKETCLTAANLWLVQVGSVGQMYPRVAARAVCVDTGEAL